MNSWLEKNIGRGKRAQHYGYIQKINPKDKDKELQPKDGEEVLRENPIFSKGAGNSVNSMTIKTKSDFLTHRQSSTTDCQMKKAKSEIKLGNDQRNKSGER